MKIRINLKTDRKGVIVLVTMLIVIAIAAISLSMVINAQINQAAANNYRNKIQTYYAADGLMTLLAQEMLDFKDSCYLKNMLRPHIDIGSPGAAGTFTINKNDSTMDTMKCGGSLGKGTSDAFHFSYIPVNGNITVYTKILGLRFGKGKTAKAGVMMRQNLTNVSKYVMVTYNDSGAHDSVSMQSRKITADSSYRCSGTFPVSAATWLKLNKSNNTFFSYYSTDGVTWKYIGSDTITMSDPVYIGLATASGVSAVRDTAIFDSTSGLPISICIDSTTIGGGINHDTIPVKYTLVQTVSNVFNMYTEAYKKWGNGASANHNFISRLNQSLGREAAGTWHATVKDSAFLPATFYDMRANMTNPEFNMSGIIKYSPAYTKYAIAHIVNDTLGSDYKPVKKTPVADFRTKYMGLWSSSWYSLDSTTRTSKNNAVKDSQQAACLPKDSTFSWDFNDSMHTWFRPWGDSSTSSETYTFDRTTGKWSGLKKRPGWSGSDSEWVTAHWDSTKPFANIVMYDTLKFMERHITSGTLKDTIFIFGDTNNSRWFDSCSNCDGARVSKFMPLHKKGFKFDCGSRYSPYATPCDSTCFYRANFGFTMEIHSEFTYKPKQFFAFRGDDDVWVFINNKLAIDLGGVHDKVVDTVYLDSLGLVSGQKYNFDFFYCERNVTGSNILITTNMFIFMPPQPTRRSWTRDYGNVD
jgi:fibro-slime domain-containing protein